MAAATRYAARVKGKASNRKTASALLLAAALLPALATGQSTQLQVDLRSKDIDVRLAAIDAIAAAADAAAERTLTSLLRDGDWEVQERAAAALGAVKSASALSKLVDLAIEGDIARVRRAAALAVAEIDAEQAAERIFKKAKSKREVLALEALALVLRKRPPFEHADKLQARIGDEDAHVREAAAVAWLEAAGDRQQALQTLTSSRHLVVRCRALDAVAEAPRAEDLAVTTALFAGEGQNPVVARRILRALAAVLAAAEGDRAPAARQALDGAGTSELTLARRAALIPLLNEGEQPVFDDKAAIDALGACLQSSSVRARSAAAKALREIGGDDALQRALRQFEIETAPTAQLQLVETVAALREPTTADAAKWLTAIVGGSYEADVRERAIVHLGRSGVQGAAETLVQVLADRSWELAVCAAVSLGKTDDDAAFAPLRGLLNNADWRMRGAAVVGLMHWSRDEAVDPLLGMLGDEHPVVARAAHEALRAMSRNFEAEPDEKAWRSWWTKNRANHDFIDREASLDKLKKYGYAVPDSEIYQGLDVVVFTSRGDHIELLLDRLGIGYRKTEASKVTADGVHPEAIFVSNCTGELTDDDVMPLRWFVKTGGSLFGSCWALSETIARIHPGVMQMARTPDQVLDDVRARPCRPDSPLLTGVFPPSVVPIYHLEGAHLIQVLDPERCEVLIDSPDAAERHGCGNLAAWFFSGHGVLFDSANHFDLQGLSVAGAGNLKKAKERQAYAVDHLGMSLATWREAQNEGYWKNKTKANERVPDLSAFRLLTNFVRSKRMGEY